VKKFLTPHQLKLYTLIWNRFVACQMTPARYAVETVDIAAGKFQFRASAQRLEFDGFLRIYHEEKEADENGNGNGAERSLPHLAEGEALTLRELTPTQSFTKPPARYSEAMLVKRLEADGIGRPSTYASIISVIIERKYTELVERKLRPTELGVAVNKILVEHFPALFDVTFTATMEKELDQIEEGSADWVKVLKQFYKPFIATINNVKGKVAEIKASMQEVTDIACTKCGSPMVVKMGRNGRFLACSAYPKCKSTRPLPEDEHKTRTGETCEKCGSEMVIKTGRFGRFMACSNYPECKNTRSVTLGIPCPKPGCGGQLVEKQSRSKRLFFGCTNYPTCDFASWDRPAPTPCPVCKNPLMYRKVTKTKGEFLSCPQCKHQVQEEVGEQTTVGS
jgi:DNA topoisomerase-1